MVEDPHQRLASLAILRIGLKVITNSNETPWSQVIIQRNDEVEESKKQDYQIHGGSGTKHGVHTHGACSSDSK